MQVFSLAGATNFECSLLCLQSFLRHNQVACSVHVLSDGTLNGLQVRRLEKIRNCYVQSSDPFAVEIAELLAPFPTLRRVHSEHVLFKKLIDVPMIAGSETFRFIDSDIYFWRDFTGLFEASSGDFPIVAQDISCSLGIRDIHCWRRPVQVWTNSGILQGPMIELAKAERLLQALRDTKRHVWEQAVYAATWGGASVEMISRNDVYIPGRGIGVPRNIHRMRAIGIHLVGDRKRLAHELETMTPSLRRSGTVSIRRRLTHPSPPSFAIIQKFVSRLFRPG